MQQMDELEKMMSGRIRRYLWRRTIHRVRWALTPVIAAVFLYFATLVVWGVLSAVL